MRFDKGAIISLRNKITDSTPLHIATEGGHFDVVKKLLDAGASASDENKVLFSSWCIKSKNQAIAFENKITPYYRCFYSMVVLQFI